MASQLYSGTTFRIGKYKADILKLASTRECLTKQGRQVNFPQGQSDTYVARRWLPYGSTAANPNVFFPTTTAVDRGNVIVAANQASEGVTPAPESLTPQDTSVTMQQFACLYGFTDKMQRLSEDDIVMAMKKQIAQRTTLVNELQIFGVLKAGTNVFYGGTGTSRVTTNGAISLNMVRRISKSLMANHADMVTELLSPGKDYGTTGVEAGFFVYGHTDLAPDIRDMPGFRPAVDYASGGAVANELGTVEMFRFVLSPEFVPILDGGATVAAAPGFQSNLGTNNDVYQFIVTAADAWSQVAVRGMDSMDVTYIPTGVKSSADPHGQRGYSGSMWWKASLIENNGWMATGNVLARTLAS